MRKSIIVSIITVIFAGLVQTESILADNGFFGPSQRFSVDYGLSRGGISADESILKLTESRGESIILTYEDSNYWVASRKSLQFYNRSFTGKPLSDKYENDEFHDQKSRRIVRGAKAVGRKSI